MKIISKLGSHSHSDPQIVPILVKQISLNRVESATYSTAALVYLSGAANDPVITRNSSNMEDFEDFFPWDDCMDDILQNILLAFFKERKVNSDGELYDFLLNLCFRCVRVIQMKTFSAGKGQKEFIFQIFYMLLKGKFCLFSSI